MSQNNLRRGARKIFTLAWRDLRGGLGSLRLCMACVALSVCMIVLVASLSESISNGLRKQGRAILGGDFSLTVVHADISSEEKLLISKLGAISTVALTRAMGRSNKGESTLVEVKAVDDAYPLTGKFSSVPDAPLSSLIKKNEIFGAIVERGLLERLGVNIGDKIFIGDGQFELRGTIEAEPDRLSSGIGFGPRAIISLDGAKANGLVQEGSLTRWISRVALHDQTVLGSTLKLMEKEFPNAGWQVRTRDDASPGVRRNIERFETFLIAVGLLTLVIGGIGVANAVRLFLEKRTRDFAVLKSLGATGSFIFIMALSEVAIIAFFGAVIGASIGVAAPFFIGSFISDLIGLPLEPAVFAREVLLSVLVGVFGASAFAILPLGSVHDLSTTHILRADSERIKKRLRIRYWVSAAGAFAVTLLTALHLLNYAKLAIYFLGGSVACVVLLILLGELVKFLCGRTPRSKNFLVRFAMANAARPRSLTRPVIVTFGLGLTMLSMLTFVDHNLQGQLTRGLAAKAPDLFLLDIPIREAERVKSLLLKSAPDAELEMTPMMRGRLTGLNGEEINRKQVRESAAWVLESDRGITFAEELPKNSQLVAGAWWSKDYRGPPIVSVDAEIAKGLGVGLGDQITMSVMGRNVTATIASLRRLEWSSMGINFVFVFSPNTFAGAPFMQIATVHFQSDSNAQQGFIRSLGRELPGVVSVQVRDALEQLAQVARRLRTGVLSLSLVVFASSVLVLGGALAASQESRMREAAILVALGATRRKLLLAFGLEFLILGLIAWGVGLLLSGAGAWTLLYKAFEVESMELPLAALLGSGAGAVALVTLLGLSMTWQGLKRPSLRLKSPQ